MIEITGRNRLETVREFKRLGVAELEGWRIVECGGGLLNRTDNMPIGMPGIDAIKPRGGIQHAAAICR